MKNLAIREQRRADGVSLDGCYNNGVIGHISRECPSGRQGGGSRGWGAGEVEEVVEEDAADRLPASKTIKTLPQPPTRGLRAVTTASSRRSQEWSVASTEGPLCLLPTVHTRDSSGS